MMFIRKDVLRVAIPVVAEQAFIMVMGVINTIMAGQLGKEAVSAVGMVDSINNIFIAFFSAFAVGGTVVVAQYYGLMGRGESKEAKSTIMYLTKATSLCLAAICLIIYPLSSLLVSAYTKNADVIPIAAGLIKTSLLSMPLLWSVSFVIPAGLKGAGDVKYTLLVSIFGMWAFRVAMGYVLSIPLGLGVLGVWLGMYFDWIVRGTLFYARLRRGKWRNNVVIRES